MTNLTTLVLAAFVSMQPQQDVKLVDMLKDCLDSTGIVKEEHRIDHHLVRLSQGIAFIRNYFCNGMNITEQYAVSDYVVPNEIGAPVIPISPYPLFIGVDGVWYADANRDGINGNEERVR